MNLTYLISSHVKFEKICLPKLLKSMDGLPIIVTIGGSDKPRTISKDNIDYHYVPYNAFEYSSLINIVENKIYPSDYVFLMHDTMECGAQFSDLSLKFKPSKICLCSEKGLCNLGAYETNYLHTLNLSKLKNCSKLTAIEKEGRLGKFDLYENSEIEVLERKDYYNTGTPRTKVYFKAVDLWKYGANNGMTLRQNKFIIDP